MRGAGFAIALAVATTGWAASPPDAAQWLVQSSAAGEQATYAGVVIFRSEHALEVLRVAHRHKNGHAQERLTSLTGSPRDILRQDDRVAILLPATAFDAAATSAGSPASLFPPVSAELLESAAEHYEVLDAGTERVAGRACRSVTLVPRDEFRYGYEVCADEQTAVPLEVSLRDREGRTVEQLMFTDVRFPARLDDATFASAPVPAESKALGATPVAMPVVAPAAPGWRLSQLPPGFRIVSRQNASGGEQILLSDGLSAVSVFGVSTAAEPTFHGASRFGAMNAYARHVGPVHVTVIGEVPAQTVRLIGEGFSAGEANSKSP